MLENKNLSSKERKFNVLYVDDEETNLRIFKISFRKDYNVFTACNGDEAIEVMDNNPIDLIITDQQMPQMTGVDLLRKIIPDNPGILRMIMTGFTDTGALIEAVNEIGINKYLKKPWSRDILKETLDNELQQYLQEKGISAATDKEDNHVEVKDTISFVQKSFLKNESEIKQTFERSFLIQKGAEFVNEVYWVGSVGKNQLFCKVSVNTKSSSTGILLNGIYATMCDQILSLHSGQEIQAGEVFEKIEKSLQAKEYASFARKFTEEGIDIMCFVKSENAVSIKATNTFGVLVHEESKKEWLSGQVNIQVPAVEKVLFFSEKTFSLDQQDQIQNLVEETLTLDLNEQREKLDESVEKWTFSSGVSSSFNLFGFDLMS